MKNLLAARGARVAATTGALLLGLALLPGAAAAITCDTRSSGANASFYGGKSASYAYDARFHAGGPTIPIPWLSSHTPQGIATWHNYSSGRNLLVVSTYRKGANARLSAVDPSTGKRVGTVEIAETHAGGITITKGWAFVQGRGSTIRKYKLSALKKKMRRSAIPYLKQSGTARKVYGSSFLTSYGDHLYAGRFNEDGRDKMYRYKVRDNGSLVTKAGAYEVPKKAQGLLVTKNRFVYSTSYGNDNRSNIYVVAGGARDIDISSTRCFRAPSMSQGITELGGVAYLLYESGSHLYVPKSPRNIIKRLHKASVSRLIS